MSPDLLNETDFARSAYRSQCQQCFYRSCMKDKAPCAGEYVRNKGQGFCSAWKPLSKRQEFEDKYGITKRKLIQKQKLAARGGYDPIANLVFRGFIVLVIVMVCKWL